MLAIMVMFDLRFAEALGLAERSIRLADRIGHRRATMIAHYARFFLCYELCAFDEAARSVDAAHEIAESLQARRFVAESLMFRALLQHATGEARARETLREGLAIAREHPFYLLPLGLGVLAMVTEDAAETGGRALGGRNADYRRRRQPQHSALRPLCHEARLIAGDWSCAEHHAAAVVNGLSAEPRATTDFVAARGCALAAAGRGEGNANELARLLASARANGWRAILPSLEAAEPR
jgi:hypothetical protein